MAARSFSKLWRMQFLDEARRMTSRSISAIIATVGRPDTVAAVPRESL